MIGIVAGLWVLVLCAAGVMRGAAVLDPFPQLASVVLLLLLLGVRLTERWRRADLSEHDASIGPGPGRAAESGSTTDAEGRGTGADRRDSTLMEAELGVLLLASAYVMLEATGGAGSPLFALVCVLVFFLSGYASRATLVTVGLLITAVETLAYTAYPEAPFPPAVLVLRIALVWLSALLHRIFLYGETLRRRAQFRWHVEEHLRSIDRDARMFRLEGAQDPRHPLGSGPRGEHERHTVGSVASIRSSLDNLIRIGAQGFSPPLRSLLLFLVDGDRFFLREAISESDTLVRTPLTRGQGVLGLVEKSRQPVLLEQAGRRKGLLPYDHAPEDIDGLAAVPLGWEGELLGILLADRDTGGSFGQEEVASLQVLAKEIVRALEFEILYLDLQGKKLAYEKLHRVAHTFNKLTRVEDVARAAVDAAQDIAGTPFAALTRHEHRSGTDVVLVARFENRTLDAWVGRRLARDAGLVSKVVKLACPLPETPLLTPRQIVFDDTMPLEGVVAAKVFPLLAKERVLGTLVVGATVPDVLPPQTQRLLEVIADHAALALAQALSYERMETLATTDGLTGLTNHRYFHVKLDEALRRAARYRKKVSLLILDLDHFKSINDTLGHPEGDKVLQGVAETLAGLSRETDVVARYGGEEFAVIMEETGCGGARVAAERIRATVAEREFRSAGGCFRCTLSIGVAAYPEHASEKTSLVAAADRALYQAKASGRNRVFVYGTT